MVGATATNGVLSNDSPGDGTGFHPVIASQPTNATVALNADGSFSITPGPGFTYGAFTYFDSDSNGSSGIARVKIGNSTPVAGDSGPYTVINTAPLAVNAAGGVLTNAYDADGDKLTAVLVSAPANGIVSLKPDGSFVYTANPQYIGPDSFTYQVSDGLVSTTPVTSHLNVISQMKLVQKLPRRTPCASRPMRRSRSHSTRRLMPAAPLATVYHGQPKWPAFHHAGC